MDILNYLQCRVGMPVQFNYTKDDFSMSETRSGIVEEVKQTKSGSWICLLNTSKGFRSFKVNRIEMGV